MLIFHGVQFMCSENETKTVLFGDSIVTNTPLPINGDGKFEKPQQPKSENFIVDLDNLLFSEDFNDPTLYETLQWHMSKCAYCTEGMTKPPPEFGHKDTRHCDEYYQIVEEYGEYELQYAWKGNP